MILRSLIHDAQFPINLSPVTNDCGTFSGLLQKLSNPCREHILTYFLPDEQCASVIHF